MQTPDRNPPPFPEEKPQKEALSPTDGNPGSYSRKKLHSLLGIAEQELRRGEAIIGDLNMQIQIYCISAHFRNGEVDEVTAARACNMSVGDFRSAQTIVDIKAREMLAILLQKPPGE